MFKQIVTKTAYPLDTSTSITRYPRIWNQTLLQTESLDDGLSEAVPDGVENSKRGGP